MWCVFVIIIYSNYSFHLNYSFTFLRVTNEIINNCVEILASMLWQFPKEKVWNDWGSRGMFPSLFPFIGVSSRWRRGNIFHMIEEILSNNRGNIIKLSIKYFEMIEDLGGCFHHFYSLFACPQGNGKKIFFQMIEEIWSDNLGNIIRLSRKYYQIIEEISSNYCGNIVKWLRISGDVSITFPIYWRVLKVTEMKHFSYDWRNVTR